MLTLTTKCRTSFKEVDWDHIALKIHETFVQFDRSFLVFKWQENITLLWTKLNSPGPNLIMSPADKQENPIIIWELEGLNMAMNAKGLLSPPASLNNKLKQRFDYLFVIVFPWYLLHHEHTTDHLSCHNSWVQGWACGVQLSTDLLITKLTITFFYFCSLLFMKVCNTAA